MRLCTGLDYRFLGWTETELTEDELRAAWAELGVELLRGWAHGFPDEAPEGDLNTWRLRGGKPWAWHQFGDPE